MKAPPLSQAAHEARMAKARWRAAFHPMSDDGWRAMVAHCVTLAAFPAALMAIAALFRG